MMGEGWRQRVFTCAGYRSNYIHVSIYRSTKISRTSGKTSLLQTFKLLFMPYVFRPEVFKIWHCEFHYDVYSRWTSELMIFPGSLTNCIKSAFDWLITQRRSTNFDANCGTRLPLWIHWILIFTFSGKPACLALETVHAAQDNFDIQYRPQGPFYIPDVLFLNSSVV